MSNYITTDAEGRVIASADWQFPGSVLSDEPVERGCDGALYKVSQLPRQNTIATRRSAILRELDAIDRQSVRPVRAKLAGTATAEDEARLVSLEAQTQTLRTELAGLPQ